MAVKAEASSNNHVTGTMLELVTTLDILTDDGSRVTEDMIEQVKNVSYLRR